MRTRTTIFLTALMSVLLLGTGIGCDSSKDGAVPESAQGRLQQTTENLPADTDFAYVISDLAGFRSNAEATKTTVERLFPLSSVLQQAKNSDAGSKFFNDKGKLQVFKKDFWKKSGIVPDGAFTLGMVDYNKVLLTYVADKKKFEKDLLSDLDVDAKPKSEKIAGKSVKTLETGDGTVVWNYRGKLATVLFPEGDDAATGDVKTPSTKETFKRVVNLKPEKSLHQSSGFKKFKSAAGDRPALAYARLTPHIKRGMLQGGEGEFNKKFAQNVEDSLDGFGFILETDKNRIDSRMWIGLTDKGKKHFDKMFRSAVTANWNSFMSADTLLAIRSAGNWKQIWNSLTAAMPEKDRKKMKKNFQMAKSSTGVDFQKDVIDNLNGQTGLVVNGIGGQATAKLLQNPASILTKLEAVYLLKFGDAKTLDKLVGKVGNLSDKNVTVRPLKPKDGKADDSIKTIEMTIPKKGLVGMMIAQQGGSAMAGKKAPVRFYVHKDTIALATSAIPEADVQKMLKGEGAGKPIKDASNLALGAKFASQKHLSGLYLNFDRFRAIFGNLVSQVPMASVQNAVKTLDEGMLSTEAADKGAWVNLTIDMVEDSGSGDKGGSK
ncbi:MAG: hypothetical protein ABEN55_17315 [Bradymonadaceae bacterium]